MSEKGRGCLIVFEGMDRSGKSMQAELLAEKLTKSGENIKKISFPNRKSVTGSVLHQYLSQSLDIDDQAVHLLFSANRWEENSKLIDLLNQGVTVICDRYAFSGVVYSMSKGLSQEWCQSSDRGLVRPDLVLYLDLPVEKAASRGGYGTERYEDQATQEKVRRWYGVVYDKSYWKQIAADREPLEVHEEIVGIVEDIIRSSRGAVIRKLWTDVEGEEVEKK